MSSEIPILGYLYFTSRTVLPWTRPSQNASNCSDSRLIFSMTVFFIMQAESYLLANLAVSDFIMGIYLIIMGSVNVHYGANYPEYDVKWRQSSLCMLAGFLSTFSGELSVLTLTAVTLDRFIVIALNTPLLKLGVRQVKGILLCLWILSFLVCLIPCLGIQYFENYYGQSEMCLPVPISSERKAEYFTSVQVFNNETDSFEWVRKVTPIISSQPEAWEYAVFVFLGINGASFLAIFIMYIWMFISVKKTQAVRSSEQKNDLAMARKMVLIVATDAFCWFPVIGLGIYCLDGNTVPLTVRCFFPVLFVTGLYLTVIIPFLIIIIAIIIIIINKYMLLQLLLLSLSSSSSLPSPFSSVAVVASENSSNSGVSSSSSTSSSYGVADFGIVIRLL